MKPQLQNRRWLRIDAFYFVVLPVTISFNDHKKPNDNIVITKQNCNW